MKDFQGLWKNLEISTMICPLKNENVTSEPKFRVFGDVPSQDTVKWMERNWTLSVYAICVYLMLIYFGQRFMKNRKPYDLQNILVLWNFGLAAFSINACFTLVPEMWRYLLASNGWHNSICFWLGDTNEATKYLFWIFVLSKMVELFDTAFIVMRKKPLTFLHWYHHISVFLYCWFTYSQQSSAAPWYAIMNYFVHSIMYTYYGIRSMQIKTPKSLAMAITTLQLLQMLLGLTVNIYAYRMIRNEIECGTPLLNIQISLLMYSSYFLLFIQFFYKSYFAKRTRLGNSRLEK